MKEAEKFSYSDYFAQRGYKPSAELKKDLETMEKKDYVDELLATRGGTHGDFTEGARTIQGLKAFFHRHAGWNKLSDRQKECFDMVATKTGRILCGDPNCKDHYLDIAGYAKLGAEECK